jgi:uncharacterized membrane protein
MDILNKKNFILGIMFFLIPIYSFIVWLYVFNTNPNHTARIGAYDKFFPRLFHSSFLQGTLIIACSALAIWFLTRIHHVNKPAAILKYTLIVISCFLIMFNIWGLL